MVKNYVYQNRTGNLTAEAVGVVKGEKYFPIFEGNMIFKPLTKSKPFSTPFYAYAEVFWSQVIDKYFMPVPKYQLSWCRGYEEVEEKYYDYGTVVPCIYNPAEGEHLKNLLEFFREHPDEKVDIDRYVNYCQMFYDYTDIFQSAFFQENRDIAAQLALHVLIAILKGDQNYHYENVAFLCDSSDNIKGLAPMIDHEFSTYFMFPDDLRENVYWFEELQCSISGKPVDAEKYQFMPNAVERKLMEKSAVVLHKNLAYIREHFPEVTLDFLNRLSKFEEDLKNHMDAFFLKKAEGYPDTANSNAWLIGRARYKDKNEEAALEYEEKYQQAYKKIDFDTVSRVALAEIQMVISQMKRELNKYEFRSIRPEEADQAVAIEQICFPPNEACSEQHMKERIATAPELFLVAVDKATGRLAGFLNGLSTDENIFRDEFFTDANLYNPAGKNVMLLGLDVLPAYRRQGIAKELVYSYARRERENGRQMLILTCLKAKVEMYEKMGFTDKGIADSTWGGEEWHEMSCRIDS